MAEMLRSKEKMGKSPNEMECLMKNICKMEVEMVESIYRWMVLIWKTSTNGGLNGKNNYQMKLSMEK
jgi:hypothetical protein